MTKTQKLPVNIKSKAMLPEYTDAQLTKMAESVGLTLEQLKQVHTFAYATYHYIGADLANCRREMGEKDFMTREELVEAVLDADYIFAANHNRIPPDIKEWLKTKSMRYDLALVYAVVGAGFPFARYE